MARITVEDCMDHVDNLFELVLTASKRARQIANGADPLVEWENDKPTVVALREIADGVITADVLEDTPEEEIEAEPESLEELVKAQMPVPLIGAE